MGWRGWDHCTGGDADPERSTHSSSTVTGGEEEIHGQRPVSGWKFFSQYLFSQ